MQAYTKRRAIPGIRTPFCFQTMTRNLKNTSASSRSSGSGIITSDSLPNFSVTYSRTFAFTATALHRIYTCFPFKKHALFSLDPFRFFVFLTYLTRRSLSIDPSSANVKSFSTIKKTLKSRDSKCGRWDLNPHERNAHKILSLARLPVPTLPHIALHGNVSSLSPRDSC